MQAHLEMQVQATQDFAMGALQQETAEKMPWVYPRINMLRCGLYPGLPGVHLTAMSEVRGSGFGARG